MKLSEYQGGLLNKFRNGTMDVWQRGTASMSVATSGAYTADGWIVVPTGASVAVAQAAGRALTANSLQVTGATSVTDVVVKQRIEGAIAAPLTSQVVTVQARVFNNTAGPVTPTLTVKHANAVDNWGASTIDVNAANLQTCANSVWTLVAYSFTDAGSAANGLEISFDFGANLSHGTQSIKITELDIRATAGMPSGAQTAANRIPPAELRPIAGELALCQRYLYVLNQSGAENLVAFGAVYATGAMYCAVTVPQPMRAAPTVTLSAASDFNIIYGAATSVAVNALAAAVMAAAETVAQLNFTCATTPLTIGQAAGIQAANANSRIFFKAEL
jgi:hypothetical protein